MDINDISEQTYISIPKGEYVRLKEIEQKEHSSLLKKEDLNEELRHVKCYYNKKLNEIKLKGHLEFQEIDSYPTDYNRGRATYTKGYMFKFNENEKEIVSFVENKLGFKCLFFYDKGDNLYMELGKEKFIRIDSYTEELCDIQMEIKRDIETLKIERAKWYNEVQRFKKETNLLPLIKRWYSLKK